MAGFGNDVAGGFVSGIPVIGNALDSLLHPEKGYQDAAAEMQKAWQQAQGYEKPYQQAGLNQLGTLNNAENALLDPSKLLADWMGKYQMSPYAQRSMENAKQSGMGAASSMGLLGSSSALNNIQQSSSDIMNADRQQFLNDLMQKYMTGIGVGQNIYNQGATAAGQMGNQAIGVGENLGQAAYGAANAPGNRLLDVFGMLAKMGMQGGGL
jgi:hypothetical protein